MAEPCGATSPDGAWTCSLDRHETGDHQKTFLGQHGVITWANVEPSTDPNVRAEQLLAYLERNQVPTAITNAVRQIIADIATAKGGG